MFSVLTFSAPTNKKHTKYQQLLTGKINKGDKVKQQPNKTFNAPSNWDLIIAIPKNPTILKDKTTHKH